MKLGVKMIIGFIIVGAAVYWFVNHSGYLPYSHRPLQYLPDMHKTPVIRPQADSAFFDDSSGSRLPPEGTISRDAEIYPYDAGTPATDVRASSNPLPIAREVVERGRLMFNTHCAVCHGAQGLGDGTVVPPFPKPPVLVSEKLEDFADSQIFHIITVGQNTMRPYSPQVREKDRWAIVHYIRVLQMAQNPSEADLKAFEEFIGK